MTRITHYTRDYEMCTSTVIQAAQATEPDQRIRGDSPFFVLSRIALRSISVATITLIAFILLLYFILRSFSESERWWHAWGLGGDGCYV